MYQESPYLLHFLIHSDAVYVGYKFGRELARHLAAADVFVFPSTTDTLGLVMLEANACGTPIAEHLVTYQQ